MPAIIRLLVTDLDGTLIGSANEFPLYQTFGATLERLRQKQGTLWAACTGRPLRSFKEFMRPMRQMDILPDYVIVRHAYIFELTRFGYLPHMAWNLRTLLEIRSDRHQTREALHRWHEMIRAGALGVRTVRRRRDRLSLYFDTEASAATAADMLRKELAPFRHLQVFQTSVEVDVRPVPFTKGMAVQQLARRLTVPHEQILAIGNGHNDISMLNGNVALLTACPANSEPQVMETVHHARGHIARGRSLAGVIEILDAYMNGRVSNELPEWWQPPSQQQAGSPKRERAPRRRSNRLPPIWLIVMIVYTVLLVFANFGALPGPIATLLLKPYRMLVSLLHAWFYPRPG